MVMEGDRQGELVGKGNKERVGYNDERGARETAKEMEEEECREGTEREWQKIMSKVAGKKVERDQINEAENEMNISFKLLLLQILPSHAAGDSQVHFPINDVARWLRSLLNKLKLHKM